MGASEHPTVAVAEIPPSWDRFSSLGMEVLSAPYASQLAEDGEAQNPSPDGLQRSIFLDPRNLESATEAQLKPTIEQAEDSSIAAEPAICQQDEEPSGSAADQRQSDKPADSHSAAETLNRLRTTLKLEGSQGNPIDLDSEHVQDDTAHPSSSKRGLSDQSAKPSPKRIRKQRSSMNYVPWSKVDLNSALKFEDDTTHAIRKVLDEDRKAIRDKLKRMRVQIKECKV